MPMNVLQFVGSPTNTQYYDLSVLYARSSLAALEPDARYRFRIALVAPDGAWRFPQSLEPSDIAAAPAMQLGAAISKIKQAAIGIAVPQMFCIRGMTDMRALLQTLQLPFIGNLPLQTAIAADKTMTKAIVGAAGVAVPASALIDHESVLELEFPIVIKPNDADNSEGISLVRTRDEFVPALAHARKYSQFVLAETYIELGREVRCGVVEFDGRLRCLPLEEYFVDVDERPIRRAIDKLKRDDTGALRLVAKTRTESWIVDEFDPIVAAVHAEAMKAYRALGSRHYNLFDFRIDPLGKPWFLESGPYCSFAPQSVIVTMMAAIGVSLPEFFAQAVASVRQTERTFVNTH